MHCDRQRVGVVRRSSVRFSSSLSFHSFSLAFLRSCSASVVRMKAYVCVYVSGSIARYPLCRGSWLDFSRHRRSFRRFRSFDSRLCARRVSPGPWILGISRMFERPWPVEGHARPFLECFGTHSTFLDGFGCFLRLFLGICIRPRIPSNASVSCVFPTWYLAYPSAVCFASSDPSFAPLAMVTTTTSTLQFHVRPFPFVLDAPLSPSPTLSIHTHRVAADPNPRGNRSPFPPSLGGKGGVDFPGGGGMGRNRGGGG